MIETEEKENNLKENQRKIYINTFTNNNFKQTQEFCNNKIRTSKYTLLTFLPIALFYQFNNAFNLFFLVTAIITAIPQISTITPVSAVAPFIVVLLISLIKEGIEDYRKYKNDKIANNSLSIIYKSPSFNEIKWYEMEVGNIIKIFKDEIIPADVLVIKTSHENGFCYLQTSNLDGETTLKPREAINYSQNKISLDNYSNDINSIFDCENNNCFIEIDQPNRNIYEAEGTIFFRSEKFYFDIKNILLRGGRLKNTDFVYGIIVYSGKETKLMKNINRSSLKISIIDRKLNYIVLYILAICICLCIICTIIGSIWREKNIPNYEKNELKADYILFYYGKSKNDFLEIFRIFCANFITLNTFIPISIIIVNAVVKLLQSIVMEFLTPEYKKDPNDQVKCFSIQLLEEIGMIKYIFTDKTGTLTQNEMEFKACSIFTELFDDENENVSDINLPVINQFENNIYTLNDSTNKSFKSKISKSFSLNNLINILSQRNIPINLKNVTNCPFNNQVEAIEEFFLNIILNHDVLTEKNNETDILDFQGANPDEVTLVTAASEIGFTFISREQNIIKIKIKNHSISQENEKKYEILQKFDFTSERQRSSIIVKDLSDNKIKLYVKGSDKKILSNINEFSKINILEKIKEDIDSFAKRGLRILCYSFKILDENSYKNWEKKYDELKYKSIKDKNLNSQLDKLIEEIETDTILLGVSALEDKLQDFVKDDIQSFIDAGINVWMITGDKMDTAESIGHSCKLFDESTEIFKIIESKDVNKVNNRMTEILGNIETINCELEEVHNKHINEINNNKINTSRENEVKENSLLIEHQSNVMQLRDNNINNINNNNINDNNINDNNNNEIKIKKKNDDKSEINDLSIYKFMLNKNIFNNSDSKFEKLSIFEGKVKKVPTSDSQKNIIQINKINNNKNEKELETPIGKTKNIEDERDHNEPNKKLSIPSDVKKFKDYFDFCEQKITEMEENNKKGLQIFRIKKLYPTFENSSFEKKIKCKYSIIIEGESITTCMKEGESEKLFWELIKNSRSLICCRASPMQKCEIVNFIKNHTKDITLAIGDGGNDVNMIKASHVGIGLFGKEGYQAAYASDYAISQFKYLKQLIFLTGRFCLKRNSYFIYQYFFKNILFTLPQLWLCFYSCFNGTNIFDDWYYMGFNSFVTVVPVAARAISEEDYDPDFVKFKNSEKKILHYLIPNIFKEYRDSIPFNLVKFFIIFFIGIIASLPIFFVPYFVCKLGIRNNDGSTFCFWDISVVVFFTIIFIHFYMVFSDTLFYDYFILLFYSIQIIIDVLFFIIYNSIKLDVDINGDLYVFLGNGTFWLSVILSCSIILIPFFILRRAEFFFGGFIVDMIKQNKFEPYYIQKFYQKKIEQMTRVMRSLTKFRKIYRNENNIDVAHDNFADQQMRKVVDEYKIHRKESKNKNN